VRVGDATVMLADEFPNLAAGATVYSRCRTCSGVTATGSSSTPSATVGGFLSTSATFHPRRSPEPRQPCSRAASHRIAAPRPASWLSRGDVMPGRAAECCVKSCGWLGCKGSGVQSPQLHRNYQGKRTARLPQPARLPQQNPQSGGRQARHQAIRDRRHLARDLRRATPTAGHTLRGLPASSATAPSDRRYGPRRG
jgi:hypothetical protein